MPAADKSVRRSRVAPRPVRPVPAAAHATAAAVDPVVEPFAGPETPGGEAGGEADAAPEATRGPGRPRDSRRTTHILRAVNEIIAEFGYENMRVQDVAERAGVSLATIYRRWPTKSDLVVAAIEFDPVPLPMPQTGDVESDIDTMLEELAAALATPEAFRRGMLALLPDEPGITAAIRNSSIPRIRGYVRELLAQEVGADHPQLELLVDLGPALIWYRSMVLGQTGDPAGLAKEVTAFVLGREPADPPTAGKTATAKGAKPATGTSTADAKEAGPRGAAAKSTKAAKAKAGAKRASAKRR